MGIQSVQNNQGVNLLQYLNAKNAFQNINTEKKNNDDDIKYGLVYGRSVIADYIA